LSVPVLSWSFYAGRNRGGRRVAPPRPASDSPPRAAAQPAAAKLTREGVLGRCASRSSVLQDGGTPCPTLRANPFPEVTELFCLFPSSTIFYRLESAHLGELMRL